MAIFSMVRTHQTRDSTLSSLTFSKDLSCFILEDGYRQVKEWGRTRIDPNIYRIVPIQYGRFYMSYAKAYGHKFAIAIMNDSDPELDKCGRHGNVRLHIGNFVTDTDGCLLCGTTSGFDKDNNLYTIQGSKDKYLAIYKFLETFFDEKTGKFSEPLKIKIVEQWEKQE
jgi:Family of unknown function (DUF5675)